MSFCRFSDNDFQCDFYAFESAEGFQLYVAGNRVTWEPPPSPYSPANWDLTQDEFSRISTEYHEALHAAPREWINLEGAGSSHRFDTLRELRDAIATHLRRGFRAPDWLLPRLDEELDEELAEDAEE